MYSGLCAVRGILLVSVSETDADCPRVGIDGVNGVAQVDED